MAGSYVDMYLKLSEYAKLFTKVWTFYIPTSSIWVLVPPDSHQHIVWSDFQILAILIGEQWYHIMVLICISLMMSDKYVFMCHLYCGYSNVLSIFFLFVVVFLLLSFESVSYILDQVCFADTSSQSVVCLSFS